MKYNWKKPLAMFIAYTSTVACIGKYWEKIVKIFLWSQAAKILKMLTEGETLHIYLPHCHCERD